MTDPTYDPDFVRDELQAAEMSAADHECMAEHPPPSRGHLVSPLRMYGDPEPDEEWGDDGPQPVLCPECEGFETVPVPGSRPKRPEQCGRCRGEGVVEADG